MKKSVLFALMVCSTMLIASFPALATEHSVQVFHNTGDPAANLTISIRIWIDSETLQEYPGSTNASGIFTVDASEWSQAEEWY